MTTLRDYHLVHHGIVQGIDEALELLEDTELTRDTVIASLKEWRRQVKECNRAGCPATEAALSALEPKESTDGTS